MNKEEEKNLREEFAEYLRHNWENRETLPVADWWLNKMKEQREKLITELRKEIEQAIVDTKDVKDLPTRLFSIIMPIIKNKE